MKNEYELKSNLLKAIENWLESETAGENDLGYISDNMTQNMAEAAWIIYKQNKDAIDFAQRELRSM